MAALRARYPVSSRWRAGPTKRIIVGAAQTVSQLQPGLPGLRRRRTRSFFFQIRQKRAELNGEAGMRHEITTHDGALRL